MHASLRLEIVFGCSCSPALTHTTKYTGEPTAYAISRELSRKRRASGQWAYLRLNGRRVDDDRITAVLRRVQ